MDLFDSDLPKLTERFLNNTIVQTFSFDFWKILLNQDKLFIDLSNISDVIMTYIFAFKKTIDKWLQRNKGIMILVMW